jgi:hypothetical protein
MTLEDEGVVLAAVLFGASVGTWATFTTWQVRRLGKAVDELRQDVAIVLKWLTALGVKLPEGTNASDQYSRGLLDRAAARLRGFHRSV